MNDLIETICEHKKNDPQIVNLLLDLIEQANINSVLELQKYEDDKYTSIETNERLTIEEILYQLEMSFVHDETHYDYLDSEAETKLKVLYDQYQEEDDFTKKTILILKIYAILDWGIPLPFAAYKLILEDKLV